MCSVISSVAQFYFLTKEDFFKRTLSAWLHYIWWLWWDQVAKTHIVVYDNKVGSNLLSSQSEEQHVRGGGIERNSCNRREHTYFCKHDAGDAERAAKSYASTTREPTENDVGVNGAAEGRVCEVQRRSIERSRQNRFTRKPN